MYVKFTSYLLLVSFITMCDLIAEIFFSEDNKI